MNPIRERDIQCLEEASRQIPGVRTRVALMEHGGRLLVWLPGLILLTLVVLDIIKCSTTLTKAVVLVGVSVLLATLIPLKRKLEIGAAKAWLMLLEQAQELAKCSRQQS